MTEVRMPGASGGGNDRTRLSLENKSGATIRAGQLVVPHSSGAGFTLYDSTRRPIGLMVADTAPTSSGEVQCAGYLTLADWAAVTGGVSLVPGSKLFADLISPGHLTSVPPTSSGAFVQPVGVAINANTLEINIGPRILL